MSDTTDSRSKWALLVGINTYPNLEQRYQLNGCVNDVELMASTLHGVFKFPKPNITILRDEKATRDGILQAMNALVERVGQNDIVVMHYSGHGSTVRDREGDELDGWDETIVPSDAGRSPHPFREITDDEIYVWLLRLTQKTPYVTLVFDCCHSGTITRDPFGDPSRWLEPDERPLEELPVSPIPADLVEAIREGGRDVGPSGWLPLGQRYVLIAGCHDKESSYEHPVGAGKYGALTYFLNQELISAEPGTTYRDVFERASLQVTAAKMYQHPQMEGARDRELFGVRDIEPMRFVSVSQRSEDTVTLSAGEAHGVARGSQWAIYRQGTKEITEASPRLGLIEIVQPRAVTSEARILEETQSGVIGAGARAYEVAHVYGEMRLKVNIETLDDNTQAVMSLKQLIDESQLLRLASPDEADVRVYLLPQRVAAGPDDPVPQLGALREAMWAVVGRDGRLMMPIHPLNENGAPTILRENLEKVVRYDNALRLKNPNEHSLLKDKVEFTLLRQASHGGWEEAKPHDAAGPILFEEGDRVALKITNRHTTPIYISVLDFGLTGAIGLLHPIAGASEQLEAGRTVVVGERVGEEIELYVPDNFPYVPDPQGPVSEGGMETFKLFATTQPADFSVLVQGGQRGALRGGGLPLTQLLDMALTGQGTRDAKRNRLPPNEEWTTVERSFLLRRRGT